MGDNYCLLTLIALGGFFFYFRIIFSKFLVAKKVVDLIYDVCKYIVRKNNIRAGHGEIMAHDLKEKLNNLNKS